MQRKRKQNKDGLSRNQNSTMPDNWEEKNFIEPNDEEFKLMIKAARRKLEVPMPAAMPWKIPIKSSGENPRVQGAVHTCHQDHITAKGMNSMTHCSLVNKFIPMPHQWKYRMPRQQWRKNGENCRKFRHGSWRKSETRKKCSMKQRLRAEKFILRHWWISVILRVRSWNLSIKSTKAESYSDATL